MQDIVVYSSDHVPEGKECYSTVRHIETVYALHPYLSIFIQLGEAFRGSYCIRKKTGTTEFRYII